jgi:hypothetical protein
MSSGVCNCISYMRDYQQENTNTDEVVLHCFVFVLRSLRFTRRIVPVIYVTYVVGHYYLSFISNTERIGEFLPTV